MTPTILTPGRMQHALRRVRETRVTETCGRVVQLIGLVVESEGPLAALGEVCRILSGRGQGETLAEVVGFRNHHLLLMPLGELHGIHPGSEVIATGAPMRVAVGSAAFPADAEQANELLRAAAPQAPAQGSDR